MTDRLADIELKLASADELYRNAYTEPDMLWLIAEVKRLRWCVEFADKLIQREGYSDDWQAWDLLRGHGND